MKLNAKQKELLNAIESELRKETALEYIRGGYENSTHAYIAACKNLKKKPSKNPRTSASEILKYPNVADFINSLKHAVAEQVQINASYVLRRLVEIDELDVMDIIKADMSAFRPLTEWPKPWRISINAIDMKRMMHADSEGTIESVVEKIKWPDKTRNLELIGKHIAVGAFGDDNKALVVNNNIMPVPSIDSIDGWEAAAQSQQDNILNANQ
jgi:phage terminase small subunit